jgi:hypothetical protein
MTAIETLTKSIIDNVLDKYKKKNFAECNESIDNFLESIKGLKKKQRTLYAGLNIFLMTVRCKVAFLQDSPEEAEILFDSVRDYFENTASSMEIIPNWEFIIQRLKINDNENHLEDLNKLRIIAEQFKEARSDSKIVNNRSGKLRLLLLELSVGLLSWAVFLGWAYFALQIFPESFNSTLVMIVRGSGFISFLAGCIIGMNNFIRGLGKVHYVFGTKGWMLRFFLFIILMMGPAMLISDLFIGTPGLSMFDGGIVEILPMAGIALIIIFFTGRGLRRTKSGELIVIESND